MKLIEVILKCNSNIFGFQLKKGGKLIIQESAQKVNSTPDDRCHLMYYEGDSFEHATYQETLASSFSTKFDRTPEDFINEANRINELFDEVEKEGGQLPLYCFDIINNNKEGAETVTLFGMNQFLLTPNFGSGKNISIIPFKDDATYLQYLQHSAHNPFMIDFIHIESDNIAQITQILTYTTKDENGQLLQVPLITQSYFDDTKKQNNEILLYHKVKIDGNSNYQFSILSDTKMKIKVYGRRKTINSKSLMVLNNLLSCQIQQGIDFVSVENVKKFTGETYNDFDYKSIENELNNLFEKGFVDFKDGLYGYKFKILKVDGTIKKELSLTQVLKHSEYNIK